MKKLYFIIAMALFCLVGCAVDDIPMDSGDTFCSTESVTPASTETETEPTGIAEQTEAPTSELETDPIEPFILRSDPSSTAPFHFIAGIEKNFCSVNEIYTITTTLINNSEPFSTNIYTYFAYCALIRELENGQYEKLFVDIPIPDGIEIQEIKSGQKSKEQSFSFSPRYVLSQIIDADGVVLDSAYLESLNPGQYHLILYYEYNQVEYKEIFNNCILIK